jgi:hypothetical protein
VTRDRILSCLSPVGWSFVAARAANRESSAEFLARRASLFGDRIWWVLWKT